jgi:hypothetical protein
MKVHSRAAVPYRRGSSHGPFTAHSGSGIPSWFVPVALLVIIALLLSPPASALPGQENRAADGQAGDRGDAASPVVAPVTNGTPSGTPSYPSIAPNETPGQFCRQFTFPFQKTNITISVQVNASLYYGAKNGDKFATVPEGVTPEAAAPAYYQAFIEDPRQDAVYTDLLHRLRAVRQEHHYSDDEYLELLAVFVQSIPYDTVSGTHPDTPARFPETV